VTTETEANESISAAEPAEATGPTRNPPTEDTGTDSVDVLKGIGPSYSATLSDADIETVADLAEADVDSLSDETGISEKRLERWSEHARARRQ
jgi:predicted flap endonuclease-1-like 5' DNA nuclease